MRFGDVLGCLARKASTKLASSGARPGGVGLRRHSNTRSTPARDPLEGEQGHDVSALQLGPSPQEGQLDHEPQPRHFRPQALDEPAGGGGGAPSGDYVVYDEHPVARLHGVVVDLEQIGAVLEVVLLTLDLEWQLARLANGHKAGVEAVGDGRGDDEAARLDAED